MKDTEGMVKEEKHKYIFVPNPTFKEGRFNWITNNLLGDIRTFLDGIEYFRIQGKGKPEGKSPRGSGNLSVPILISTALEFVAALYTGKTKYMKNISYNATDNVRSFIKDFFPEKYREIPLLHWDGIRNGLVHTFSPRPFKYQNNYIRFQFYVEDRNVPSHIKKDKDTIWISINVFELYRILENAVKDYHDELKNNDGRQDKFIKAWSSIEEDSRREIAENSEYRDDAKTLLDYLGSSSGALLLEDLNKVVNMDVLRIYTPKIRRS